MPATASLDRTRLARLMDAEMARFEVANPRSRALWERASGSLLEGVPMNWMVKWAGPFPLFVDGPPARISTTSTATSTSTSASATPARWPATARRRPSRAVERQLRRGITHMLPTEDAIVAADELRRRFGLPSWQFTLTATDANRFAIRLARDDHRPAEDPRPRPQLPRLGRRDVRLAARPTAASRPGAATSAPPVDPAETTRVVRVQRRRRARAGARERRRRRAPCSSPR